MRGITTGIVTLAACAALSACGGASASAGSTAAASATSGPGSATTSGAGSTSSPAETSAPTLSTGEELERQAMAALDGATSLRFTGTIPEDGKLTRLDIAGPRRGQDVRATFVVSGDTVEVVRKGDVAYSRISMAGKRPSGAWRRVSQDRLKSGEDMVVQAMVDEWLSDGEAVYAGAKVTAITHQGQRAYLLDAEVADEEELIVAADPPHRPLAIRGTEKGLAYELRFTEWNAVPPIVVPPRR